MYKDILEQIRKDTHDNEVARSDLYGGEKMKHEIRVHTHARERLVDAAKRTQEKLKEIEDASSGFGEAERFALRGKIEMERALINTNLRRLKKRYPGKMSLQPVRISVGKHGQLVSERVSKNTTPSSSLRSKSAIAKKIDRRLKEEEIRAERERVQASVPSVSGEFMKTFSNPRKMRLRATQQYLKERRQRNLNKLKKQIIR